MKKEFFTHAFQALFIFFSFFDLISGFIQSDCEIMDLQGTTLLFKNEAVSWEISPKIGTLKASQCSSTWLLGGYGVVGDSETTITRKYTSLPTHNAIHFFAEVWLIDLNLPGSAVDLFEFYFDEILIQKWDLQTPTSMSIGKICGDPLKNDYTTKVYGQVAHNQNELNFKIVKAGNPANNFTIGFRSLQISFIDSIESSLVCKFKDLSGTDPSCECPDNSYNEPSKNKCSSCNNGCTYCFGPSTTDCLACKSNYFFDGKKCSKCDSTCDRCDGSSSSECVQCPTGTYLFPDGTCKSACSTPMIARQTASGTICQLPCNTGYYMYWNGSCLTECNSPLKPNTSVSSSWLCNLPCNELLDQYYVPENDTCVSECPAPLIIEETDLINFCLSSISNTSNTTVPESNSTNTTAPETNVTNATIPEPGGSNTTIPESNLTNTTYTGNSPNSSTTFTNLVTTMTNIGETVNAIASAIRSNNANSVFMVSIAKLIRYVVYIQVPLLDEVRKAFLSSKSSVFSMSTAFSYPMPQSIKDEFLNQPVPVPSPFDENISTASYLYNNWEPISTYLILISFGIVFSILEKLTIKTSSKALTEVARRFRILTRWNFVILILFNSYDNFTLYAILEFRTLHLDSPWSIVSFLTCSCITIIAVFLLWTLFKACREAQKAKNRVQDQNMIAKEDPSNMMETCQVLYAGYKNDSFLKLGCLLFQTIRIIIYYILVACLYTQPLIQTTQLTLISVFMLVYVIKQRPFTDNFNLFVTLVFEAIIIIVNICLMSLAILDEAGTLTSEQQTILSGIILISNTAVEICSTIFMYIYILLAIKIAYKASQTGLRGKTFWIYVPIVAYESPGLDFKDDSLTQSSVSTTIPMESLSQQASKSRQLMARKRSTKTESTFVANSLSGGENDYEHFSQGMSRYNKNSSTLSLFSDEAKPIDQTSFMKVKVARLRSRLRKLFRNDMESKKKVFPSLTLTREKNVYVASKPTGLRISGLEEEVQLPKESSLSKLVSIQINPSKEITSKELFYNSPKGRSRLMSRSPDTSMTSLTRNEFTVLPTGTRRETKIFLRRQKDEEFSSKEETEERQGFHKEQSLNPVSTIVTEKSNSLANIYTPRRLRKSVIINIKALPHSREVEEIDNFCVKNL